VTLQIVKDKLREILIEGTTAKLVEIVANNTGNETAIVKFLPHVAGAISVHSGVIGAFCGPIFGIRRNYKVFRMSMRFSGGHMIVSCVATVIIYVLQFFPGPQQGPSRIVCQTLICYSDGYGGD
jgi:hypothetical protein